MWRSRGDDAGLRFQLTAPGVCLCARWRRESTAATRRITCGMIPTLGKSTVDSDLPRARGNEGSRKEKVVSRPPHEERNHLKQNPNQLYSDVHSLLLLLLRSFPGNR